MPKYPPYGGFFKVYFFARNVINLLVAKKRAIKQQKESLSPREVEVLKLFVLLQKKQIATKLFIDYETVKTHIKNCVIKLNAKQPRHAIYIAKERGLI
jgi:DNA-binding NarL/FixJ family response regulator